MYICWIINGWKNIEQVSYGERKVYWVTKLCIYGIRYIPQRMLQCTIACLLVLCYLIATGSAVKKLIRIGNSTCIYKVEGWNRYVRIGMYIDVYSTWKNKSHWCCWLQTKWLFIRRLLFKKSICTSLFFVRIIFSHLSQYSHSLNAAMLPSLKKSSNNTIDRAHSHEECLYTKKKTTKEYRARFPPNFKPIEIWTMIFVRNFERGFV